MTAYSMPMIRDVPKIILADLSDNRLDKKTLGQVGLLILGEGDPTVNVILTNRIAKRLRDEGFNVQKTNLTDPANAKELDYVMLSSSGNAYLSGGVNTFYVSSFDAIMETGKGAIDFYIDVLDKSGNAIYDGKYSASAEHWIGLGGLSGTQKLIEMTVQAAVEDLFNDTNFEELLNKMKQ
jgi:hypothetical protein